jgi:CelD/BcsL family acetyltransferase involved in cellulose biosynthesis
VSVPVFVLDPLVDGRWDDLLARDTRASAFHSRGWLEGWRRTYGYEPIVLTTTESGPLTNGLALCRVHTLTSRWVVSLPFSDHCEPLIESPDDLPAMVGFLTEGVRRKRWNSIQMRPRCAAPTGLGRSASYCLHTLDLTPPLGRILSSFHPSCTRRSIRRASREGLRYETGTSDRLLSSFYDLLRLTRRRHGLPPQPVNWFRNLVSSVGDGLRIHVASKDGTPVASMLTLFFKKTMVYKYGGSDARFHRLGSVPYLFWSAIQEAKAQGIEELDLGRSGLDQSGLTTFKDHLGATRQTLTYYTYPERFTVAAHDGPLARVARRIVRHLPDAAVDLAGRLFYRHLG